MSVNVKFEENQPIQLGLQDDSVDCTNLNG